MTSLGSRRPPCSRESHVCETPFLFLVGVVRERPAATSQSRRFLCMPIPLRAVHAPLPGKRRSGNFYSSFSLNRLWVARRAKPRALRPNSKPWSFVSFCNLARSSSCSFLGTLPSQFVSIITTARFRRWSEFQGPAIIKRLWHSFVWNRPD